MLCARQIVFLLCGVLLGIVVARPDSGGHVPLPGPGLSYGGIPYGSMSGNVAEYFRHQAPSISRSGNYAHSTPEVDFAPIEQWL